ncbi:MAG: hypothetical protein ABJB95_05510 [Gemmatimonadales bacterium]
MRWIELGSSSAVFGARLLSEQATIAARTTALAELAFRWLKRAENRVERSIETLGLRVTIKTTIPLKLNRSYCTLAALNPFSQTG